MRKGRSPLHFTSAKLLPTKKFPVFWVKFSTIKGPQEMDPPLQLKGKGKATMETEEIQLKRNLQQDGQSAITTNNKQMMDTAFAFMVYSFTLMCVVVGDNGIGRFVRGDTIRFSICFVADTLVFVASSAVTTILATGSHVSANMDYFIRIFLLATGVFVFIYHAISYEVAPPS